MQFPISDRFITGQSGVTALNQNLLLESAGTGSVEKLGFRSLNLQITPAGTITAGSITFEGSNDDTNWVSIVLYNKNSNNSNPVGAYALSTGVTMYFEGPCLWRYIRVRVSVALTGAGAGVRAWAVLSPETFYNQLQAVTQQTAANLNATVSGTVTANLGTGGTGATSLGKAEDAVAANGDTGVPAWAVRRDTPGTNVSAAGDYSELAVDELTRLYVNGDVPVSKDQGFLHYRNTALTLTAVAVKASAGNLYGITVYNVLNTPVYLKFYDQAQGSVNVASSTPAKVFLIPASDGTTPGAIVILADHMSQRYFGTAISMLAAMGIADTNNVAPGTGLYVEVIYK